MPPVLTSQMEVSVVSQNVGEEIAGQYLLIVKNCQFVQYNLYPRDAQGEIDVVAINVREKTVYVCEVAVHLVTGLQYVKNARPDTVPRLLKKFNKDIAYAEMEFRGFKKVYMLWSPIVKHSAPGAKHDQLKAVEEVWEEIRRERGVEIELVINERYSECLAQLREHAGKKTEELKSPVLRLLQIEELLARHLARNSKKKSAGHGAG
jgi:hypothetical protein